MWLRYLTSTHASPLLFLFLLPPYPILSLRRYPSLEVDIEKEVVRYKELGEQNIVCIHLGVSDSVTL